MREFKRNNKYICEKCGKFSRIRGNYCGKCGAPALRKATKSDYKKITEQLKIEQSEHLRIRTKMKEMLVKQKKILQALIKNDAEYKNLLERKKSGESVEDLITKNREYNEKLIKEKNENSEIAIKWGQSEEGRKMFARIEMNMKMWARTNPIGAGLFQIKKDLEFRMIMLDGKIQKIEEEYKKLLERKNNDEYVDDLIKQNRYSLENLKQTKRKFEDIMKKLRIEGSSDWKKKII